MLIELIHWTFAHRTQSHAWYEQLERWLPGSFSATDNSNVVRELEMSKAGAS